MARPIILKPAAATRPLELKPGAPTTGRQLSKAELDLRLRMKRSTRYIQTIAQLDAGSHCKDVAAVEALIAAIQEELPEVTIEKQPLGIVSRCNLGEDFEVHTLDRSGCIVQHYRRSQSLPALLERARSLALHPQYVFIEVYVDSMVAVRANGDVSLIQE